MEPTGQAFTEGAEMARDRGREEAERSFVDVEDVEEALGRDVAGWIERHPMQSVLISLGVGYLVGRMLSR